MNRLFAAISFSYYTSISTEENLNCSALNPAVSTKDSSSTWWLDLPSESVMSPISTPSLRIWNVEYLANNASNVLDRPSSYGCQRANVVRRRSLNCAGVSDIICNFIIRAPLCLISVLYYSFIVHFIPTKIRLICLTPVQVNYSPINSTWTCSIKHWISVRCAYCFCAPTSLITSFQSSALRQPSKESVNDCTEIIW